MTGSESNSFRLFVHICNSFSTTCSLLNWLVDVLCLPVCICNNLYIMLVKIHTEDWTENVVLNYILYKTQCSVYISFLYIPPIKPIILKNKAFILCKHFICMFFSFMELSTHCLIDFLFLSLELWSFVVLGQVICVFLVWWLLEYGLLPQIWGKVGICLGDSSIGGLSCKRQNKELT